MTQAVYELAIIGGRLPDDDNAAFTQTEHLEHIVAQMDGEVVGAWEWHFPTFNAAAEAARGFRRVGLVFDDVRIKAVDAHSGKDLPS
jgi:hypothetical protein